MDQNCRKAWMLQKVICKLNDAICKMWNQRFTGISIIIRIYVHTFCMIRLIELANPFIKKRKYWESCEVSFSGNLTDQNYCR